MVKWVWFRPLRQTWGPCTTSFKMRWTCWIGSLRPTAWWSMAIRPGRHSQLRESYSSAVAQLRTEHFERARAVLMGEDPAYPVARVLGILSDAGWTGELQHFKLQMLSWQGREAVMAAVHGAGGGIARNVLKAFLAALNAALDSLQGFPAVGAIRELKDFVEPVVGG